MYHHYLVHYAHPLYPILSRLNVRPFDYDNFAHYYDLFELGGNSETERMNAFLNRIFKERGARSVLDITCGTGAQAVGLAKFGYEVTASDQSKTMLLQARKKGCGLGIRFKQGDMRTIRLGPFDAVISIFV